MFTYVHENDQDKPQLYPGEHWKPAFKSRVRAARIMLAVGCSEQEVRDAHGVIVLREAKSKSLLRKVIS